MKNKRLVEINNKIYYLEKQLRRLERKDRMTGQDTLDYISIRRELIDLRQEQKGLLNE